MPIAGGEPFLTDSDVEALVWQFLNSEYVGGDTYARGSPDKRLQNFLRRSGLTRVADNGDLYNIIFDRVMSGISRLSGSANTSPDRGSRPPIAGSTT
jgi:hypothetical protein